MMRTVARAFVIGVGLLSFSAPAWAATAVQQAPLDAPAAGAFLSIECDPKAHAYVDDKDTALDTPVTDFPVTAGKHTVRLVTADGRSQSLAITLKSGDHKHVRIKM